MKYFSYVDKGQSAIITYKIQQVLNDLAGYAKTIYKNGWEDALDKAFFHILHNYEPECGDLEHYATTVVRTIDLNKNKKEITHDIVLDTAMDAKSVECSSADLAELYLNNQEDIRRSDIKECLNYMIPRFIKDYKFFLSNSSQDRLLDYSDMFKRFEISVINETQKFIVGTYAPRVQEMLKTPINFPIKRFTHARLMRTMDKSLEYKGCINNIVIYKKARSQHNRFFYYLDFKKVNSFLLRTLYYENEFCCNHIKIEEFDVFISLSKTLCLGEDALFEKLEPEILSIVLTKIASFRIVTYEKGEGVLLSCSRSLENIIEFEAFGTKGVIELERRVAKIY